MKSLKISRGDDPKEMDQPIESFLLGGAQGGSCSCRSKAYRLVVEHRDREQERG